MLVKSVKRLLAGASEKGLIVPKASARQKLGRSSQFILIAFLIDRSPSMFSAEGWPQVEAGFGKAIEAMRSNAIVRSQAEVAIYGFGAKHTTAVFQEFTPVASIERVPHIPNACGTYLYELFCRSVAETAIRRDMLIDEHDREPLASWILYFSDFCAIAQDQQQYQAAATQAKSFATENGISIFNFPCGDQVSSQVANDLSQPGRPPMPIKSTDWESFFAWFHRSVEMTSRSLPGQSLILPSFNGNAFRVE